MYSSCVYRLYFQCAAEEQSPYCGGVLISSSWLLTSATCSYMDTSVIGTDT
jgi:hypothetical protein